MKQVAWEEYFADTAALVATINERLERDKAAIRYVNLKYKCAQQEESKWCYDVKLSIQENQLVIATNQGKLYLAADSLEYIRLRPFYYAACVGFKEMVLRIGQASNEIWEN